LNFKQERPDVAITPEYVRELPLTARDRGILNFLDEVGYGTTDQLGRLFYAHTQNPTKQASRRLLRLWNLHVLDRMVGDGLPKYGLSKQLVYSLGRAGLLVVKEQDDPGSQRRKRRGSGLLKHNTLLGHGLVQMWEQARDLSTCRLRFYGERGTYTTFTYQQRRVKMRPDGLIYQSDDTNGQERVFFVELDTGTREVSSYQTKIRQYELFFASEQWKDHYPVFPAILVWIWSSYDSQHPEGVKRRQAKAERRLENVIEYIQQQRKRTRVLWFFARLDQAGHGPWKALVQNNEIKRADLFGPFRRQVVELD
jgi:hypothetical protein